MDMPFLNENGLNFSRRQRCQGFCTEGLLCAWNRSSGDGDDAAKAGRNGPLPPTNRRCPFGNVRVSYSDNNNSRQLPGSARPRRLDESASSVLRFDHHKPRLGEPNVRTTHSGWQAVAGHRAEADGQRLPVSRSIRPIRVGVRMLRRVRTHPALASVDGGVVDMSSPPDVASALVMSPSFEPWLAGRQPSRCGGVPQVTTRCGDRRASTHAARSGPGVQEQAMATGSLSPTSLPLVLITLHGVRRRHVDLGRLASAICCC